MTGTAKACPFCGRRPEIDSRKRMVFCANESCFVKPASVRCYGETGIGELELSSRSKEMCCTRLP